MREIEFRGLTTYQFYQKPPEKEWVYGSLQISYEGFTRIIPLDPAGPWDGVDPETVGQYTGMKDKHGQKIYEGDVIKFSWLRGFTIVESLQVVRFCKDGAAFKFWDGQSWCPFWGFSDEDMEVVGNIFDNPELDKQFGEVYRSKE